MFCYAANKDQVLQQAKQMEMQEQNSNRPKALANQAYETPTSQLNFDNTVFAFTRIMWLGKGPEIMQAMAMDPLGVEMFTRFVKTTTHLYQYHFDFLCKFAQIAMAQGPEQGRLIRLCHRKKYHNAVFYCTNTEINYGALDQTNWAGPFQEMQQKSQITVQLLATELLPKFLNSKLGYALLLRVRAREVQGQPGPLRTIAMGLDKNAESYWLDMFKILAESVPIGMVSALALALTPANS